MSEVVTAQSNTEQRAERNELKTKVLDVNEVLWMAGKDKGVEAGFIAIRLQDLLEDIPDKQLRDYVNNGTKSITNEEVIDKLFLWYSIKVKYGKAAWTVQKSKYQEAISCYDEILKKVDGNFFRRILGYFSSDKKKKLEELAEIISYVDPTVIARNVVFCRLNEVHNYHINRNALSKYQRQSYERILKDLPKSELQKIDDLSKFITKGDNEEFLGLSVGSVTLKNLIRAIFEAGCETPNDKNKSIIGEIFALNVAGFLGGIVPRETLLCRGKYIDGTPKFMSSSTLFDDFMDFQGHLIDSNTDEEQSGNQNYNRLIPSQNQIKVGDSYASIKNMAESLICLAILDDLDGVGAQGQNIGMNKKTGEILFFDFGHAFSNKDNLGAGFWPQLGSGNLKSRNIASFFSGLSLLDCLERYKIVKQKIEDGFEQFIEDFKTKYNLDNKDYSEYSKHIDMLKDKVLDRVKYINELFENRLNILDDADYGKLVINLLDNLQLLIFQKNLTSHSPSGVSLKEGKSYFDVEKDGDYGLYKMVLKGKSHYGNDKQYSSDYENLIREFRNIPNNRQLEARDYKFLAGELVGFYLFILNKRKKQVKNFEQVVKTIEDEIKQEKNKEQQGSNLFDTRVKTVRGNQQTLDKIKEEFNGRLSKTKILENSHHNNHKKVTTDEYKYSERDYSAAAEASDDSQFKNKYLNSPTKRAIGLEVKYTVNKNIIILELLNIYSNTKDNTKYSGYKISIGNLSGRKEQSIFELTSLCRENGLEKGVKLYDENASIHVSDEDGKPVSGSERKAILKICNKTHDLEEKRRFRRNNQMLNRLYGANAELLEEEIPVPTPAA